ncbi:SRPBCC domain-containing protein [Actinoallomurus sp. NPDC052274]|uniref:SRPBCC family protein n=1 Tax=Actinoallomurus sp. NPDC052274 TaxID=3155420 RepID=UPI00342FE5BE
MNPTAHDPNDPRTIRVDEFLPHPPAAVWRALTDSDLMARWLMPNDFKLVIGHAFTFQGTPIPQAGFGGTGHGTVLDFTAEKMLRISWCAAPEDPSRLESTVTFTLQPEGTGTRLFLVHDGFDPDDPYQVMARRFMGGGWPGVAARIGEVIGEGSA